MPEPVEDLTPPAEHLGSGLAHAIGVRELAGAASDRSQRGLVEGDVLGLGQSLQQCAVFIVKPQIHGHDDMVPKWYYVSPLSDARVYRHVSEAANHGQPR